MGVTLRQLNGMPADAFVAALGAIFEHSPWVVRQAAAQRPYADLDRLHATLCAIVDAASEAAQLQLIHAHPELAGKAAVRGKLTHDSIREQSGAGLDQCSPEQFDRLRALNDAYRTKFGFPFILAVRGYDRDGIIANFETRVAHDRAAELRECLAQIYRIARFRLEDRIAV